MVSRFYQVMRPMRSIKSCVSIGTLREHGVKGMSGWVKMGRWANCDTQYIVNLFLNCLKGWTGS